MTVIFAKNSGDEESNIDANSENEFSCFANADLSSQMMIFYTLLSLIKLFVRMHLVFLFLFLMLAVY